MMKQFRVSLCTRSRWTRRWNCRGDREFVSNGKQGRVYALAQIKAQGSSTARTFLPQSLGCMENMCLGSPVVLGEVRSGPRSGAFSTRVKLIENCRTFSHES